MPDNDRPAAKQEPEASPGEFDFAAPVGENPRLKKRTLKPRTEVKTKTADEPTPARSELEREAPARTAPAATPAPVRAEEDEAVEPARSAASAQPHFASTARPATTAATPAVSPHGTRPATLYYSTGKDKKRETVPPMKTTIPTASTPASANPAPSSAPSSSSSSFAARPATVVDYRSNMDRQAREQRSMGNLLAIIVYVLIGFFVLSTFLAGYGIYALSKQIKKQSLTIDELDKHYAAETQALASENQKLNTQLQSTMDTLTQAQAQIGRQQSLILQEQEAINKLAATADATAAALRQERAARAEEASELRERIRDLEYHGPTTQHY